MQIERAPNYRTTSSAKHGWATCGLSRDLEDLVDRICWGQYPIKSRRPVRNAPGQEDVLVEMRGEDGLIYMVMLTFEVKDFACTALLEASASRTVG